MDYRGFWWIVSSDMFAGVSRHLRDAERPDRCTRADHCWTYVLKCIVFRIESHTVVSGPHGVSPTAIRFFFFACLESRILVFRSIHDGKQTTFMCLLRFNHNMNVWAWDSRLLFLFVKVYYSVFNFSHCDVDMCSVIMHRKLENNDVGIYFQLFHSGVIESVCVVQTHRQKCSELVLANRVLVC